MNQFPDKFVTKEELMKEYFSFLAEKTLSKYLTDIRKNNKYCHILLSPSKRLTFINVKGFYEYLRYKEKNKFRV